MGQEGSRQWAARDVSEIEGGSGEGDRSLSWVLPEDSQNILQMRVSAESPSGSITVTSPFCMASTSHFAFCTQRDIFPCKPSPDNFTPTPHPIIMSPSFLLHLPSSVRLLSPGLLQSILFYFLFLDHFTRHAGT